MVGNKSCSTCRHMRQCDTHLSCEKNVWAKFKDSELPSKLAAAEQCPFYDSGAFVLKRMEQLIQKGYTVDEAFEIDEREAMQSN